MDVQMNECCDKGKCYVKEYPNGDSTKGILNIVDGKLYQLYKLV